tara:strand:+ start:3193 stop:3936 length:744 start_codon:yes stop_codon:yes gene_type:complete
MKENQKFYRYEFKYILNKEISDHIEDEAKNFMNYDGYVNKELHNRYYVRSLYFENNFSSNFYEKADGMKIRRKYRLRTYNNNFDPKVPIFFEVKGRASERTYKKRMSVKNSDLNYFLLQNENFNLLKLYPDNEIVKDFIFDSLRKNLKPRILVDYKRRPYINRFGLYFRLTFDTNLLTSKSNSLFEKNNHSSWLACKAGYTILEVKFDRSIPAWFHRIIQCYNLRRRSISKFVIGMSYCGIARETSE